MDIRISLIWRSITDLALKDLLSKTYIKYSFNFRYIEGGLVHFIKGQIETIDFLT